MSGARLKPPKRRTGLAEFRALEVEVHAALVAGRTVRAIYEEKRSRLDLSYRQFARYAGRVRHRLEIDLPGTRAYLPAAALPIRNGGPRRAGLDPVSPRLPRTEGAGPPKGRPEDAIPKANMDRFAAKALANKDLF